MQLSVKFKKIGAVRNPAPLWKSYLQACAAAFFVALILRAFVIQAYRIPTGSMEDTVVAGDFVMVNKVAYWGSSTPLAGDVIVFEYPLNRSRDFVKRVIATGGQTVALRDKQLYVDGRAMESEDYAKNIDPEFIPSVFSNRDNFGPITVPSECFFVMGDNRDNSQDSRFWGTVPLDHVKGRLMFVYWSYAPAPDAPEWEFPYIQSAFPILWYNVTHMGDRMRLDRIGHVIR
jgi:signal peptidase I